MKVRSIRTRFAVHSKVKGNIGELLIAADLVKKGYPVFTELGDNSKTDLIALVEEVPVKIQVKSYNTNENGSVVLRAAKSGPNYRFKYTTEQVDVFALYILDANIICYVSAAEVIAARGGIKIRPFPAKNKQTKGLTMADKYASFEAAIPNK